MKKMLISIISIITIFSSLFIITGCGKKEEGITGTWERSGFVYKFNKDKTGSYDTLGNKMNFTYEDKGNKVILHYKSTNKKGVYNYRIKKNKLIIQDSFENDVEYNRK